MERRDRGRAVSMRARMVMLGAAGVVVLAAFLPWASFLSYSKAGIDGDGVMTLVIALVGLLLLWRGWLGWIGQLILAGLVAAIGIYDLNDAGNLAAIGLYLTFLAGVVWVIAAIASRKSVVPEPPTVTEVEF
jgi:hypothetical protein